MHVSKIKNLKEINKISEALHKDKKKIILAHGVFDLIHPGHIRYFDKAKSYADVLVVTITGDKFVKKGPGRPFFNEQLRSEVLSSLTSVDYISIVNDESALPAIEAVKPDFYIKGPDYKNRKKTYRPQKLLSEEKLVKKYGGKTVFTDDIVFSSSHLLNQFFDSTTDEVKTFLEKFKKKYNDDLIFSEIEKLKRIKILLIGDAIIDEYCYSNPLGKSSKEPIVVHKYIHDETYLGGVLATANNLTSTVDKIDLVTILGKEKSYLPFIKKNLHKKIKTRLFFRKESQTIVKRRYIDNFTRQKLFQVSYLPDTPISGMEEQAVINYLKNKIRKYDLVMVNDFGHGLLTPKIIELITRKARFLSINVQANSANFGFNVVTKYKHADFICIDEAELRLATHDRYGDTYSLMQKIYKELKPQTILVTKGPYGSYIYNTTYGLIEVPSLTQKIVDRVGAGDALFAAVSPCVYHGFPPDLSAFIGNVVAALKLQIIGNKTSVDKVNIQKFITRLLK